MLVLSRKRLESISIDDGKITVMVMEILGNKVKLGIEAPRGVSIHREEVWLQINQQSPAKATREDDDEELGGEGGDE